MFIPIAKQNNYLLWFFTAKVQKPVKKTEQADGTLHI